MFWSVKQKQVRLSGGWKPKLFCYEHEITYSSSIVNPLFICRMQFKSVIS